MYIVADPFQSHFADLCYLYPERMETFKDVFASTSTTRFYILRPHILAGLLINFGNCYKKTSTYYYPDYTSSVFSHVIFPAVKREWMIVNVLISVVGSLYLLMSS